MPRLQHLIIVTLFLLATGVLFSFLPRFLDPSKTTSAQRLRDKLWVSSSPYWIDRQTCRWLGLCGIHHVRSDPAAHGRKHNGEEDELRRLELRRRSGEMFDGVNGPATRPNGWEYARPESTRLGRRDAGPLQHVPDYVLKYAPLVHLHSEEYFFPSDIAEHIEHMMPYTNGSALNLSTRVSLDDMHSFNERPLPVYLTSVEDVEDRPDWLHSHVGLPAPFAGDGTGAGEGDQHMGSGPPREDTSWWDVDKDHPLRRISPPRQEKGGRQAGRPLRRRRSQQPVAPATPMYKPESDGFSNAPAVLILADKGSGIVDAFWFFFYSYNLGQTVLKIRFGNHVGDWEHCMVRFEHGVPRALFMSEHWGGQAYAWSALEKLETKVRVGGVEEVVERPVIYSAIGSHAMYATPGNHPYVLPFGMLKDVTDRGPLWDPAKNTYAYYYDYEADRHGAAANGTSLTPAASNPDAPTSWFHFEGPWGDELYALSDIRQWRLFGQYHYITGPLGPKFKDLDRRNMCQMEWCTILYTIEEGEKAMWYD